MTISYCSLLLICCLLFDAGIAHDHPIWKLLRENGFVGYERFAGVVFVQLASIVMMKEANSAYAVHTTHLASSWLRNDYRTETKC